MTRRSVSATARAHEEFDVAVAARDRRRKYLDIGASKRSRECRDVVTDFLMHHRVADDAALGMPSLRLELRLDQRQQLRRRGGQFQRHWQHGLQRDETDVYNDDIGPRGQALAFEG